MKKTLAAIALAATAILGTINPASALTDVVEYNAGYFTPNQASTYSAPYYRWNTGDWGWSHSAINGGFTSASLYISAWDVDKSWGEVDNIYAYDGANKVLLGSLNGLDNDWGYTTFNLGANFFDDIATGLKIFMDIDANNQGWAVTLSKSVLTLDGGYIPNPEPGNPVPEPSTMILLGTGLLGLGFARKKFAKK